MNDDDWNDGETRSVRTVSSATDIVRQASSVIQRKLYYILTFKGLTYEQYRFLLGVTIIINIVFDGLQIARMIWLFLKQSLTEDNALSLLIVGVFLTTINIANILLLMTNHAKPNIAFTSMGIILAQEVVFITETILLYDTFKDMVYIVVLSAVFLFLQLISVFVVYRFWEWLMYNHSDDGSWDFEEDAEGGGGGGRNSTSVDRKNMINNNNNKTSSSGINPGSIRGSTDKGVSQDQSQNQGQNYRHGPEDKYGTSSSSATSSTQSTAALNPMVQNSSISSNNNNNNNNND